MSEGTVEELQERVHQLEENLRKVKSLDELTGLYNRNTYYDRVRCRFENEPDKEYVIVCFDVEKFKFVNDRFGFVEGDRLLSYIGKKLQERAAKYDLVAARLSGDVFSFMDFEENIQPDALGAEIQSWVKDYPIDFEIRMTVGIYHVKTKNIPVRLMCDRASFACESIKNNYLVNVAEYNDSVKNYVFSQHELLNESERAFENHEFKVYLQPKYDIRTTKVMGAESLVRWQHPEKGLIFPKDFIPMFEQNMLITKLDEYIWEESCRILRDYIDKGYTAVPISVNVSRMDIYSLDLSKIFVNLTEKYNIERRYLEIEITESAFTSDEEQILKAVDELRELGFIVLMDDFGSGYSSLNMLKDISVDVLKIDTRFLEAGRDGNTKGKEILESVIKMAKWIGLSVIAEGVETDEQKNFLLDRGCNYAQGFYFSRAIDEESFGKLISDPNNVANENLDNVFDNTIEIEELLHSDFMTEGLLNNILGGVALYSLSNDGNKLNVLKANEFYYSITKNYPKNVTAGGYDGLENLHPDDREKAIKAFRESKTAGNKGVSVQVRNVFGEDVIWLSIKIFYLASREDCSIYYASVSDSSEQMGVLSKLSMLRRSFETALDLIDAIALEYYFINNTIDVKTKLAEGHSYMFGTYIQNALEYILDKKIVHHDSMDEYKILCKHLKKSDKPISVVLDLLYKEGMYNRCKVTAKTVYGNGKRIKSVIVIESTGLDVKP